MHKHNSQNPNQQKYSLPSGCLQTFNELLYFPDFNISVCFLLLLRHGYLSYFLQKFNSEFLMIFCLIDKCGPPNLFTAFNLYLLQGDLQSFKPYWFQNNMEDSKFWESSYTTQIWPKIWPKICFKISMILQNPFLLGSNFAPKTIILGWIYFSNSLQQYECFKRNKLIHSIWDNILETTHE